MPLESLSEKSFSGSEGDSLVTDSVSPTFPSEARRWNLPSALLSGQGGETVRSEVIAK